MAGPRPKEGAYQSSRPAPTARLTIFSILPLRDSRQVHALIFHVFLHTTSNTTQSATPLLKARWKRQGALSCSASSSRPRRLSFRGEGKQSTRRSSPTGSNCHCRLGMALPVQMRTRAGSQIRSVGTRLAFRATPVPGVQQGQSQT